MRARFSSVAWRIFVIGVMAGLTSCNWKPVARPVRPEPIVEGPTRLEMLLDAQGRYVLTSRDGSEDGEMPRRAYSIVDWKTREHCDLPEAVVRFIQPILGPNAKRKAPPAFFLPITLQHEDVQHLAFVDEHCEMRGETDYGVVASTMHVFTQDDDGREVLLYGNGKGTLAIADPWNDQRTEVAQGVRTFAFVQRASALNAPQLLWLLQDGVLTQRTLDGELVLSLGKEVTEFTQALFGELRIAYVDGGDLFEALGPDFAPTRIAEAACMPVYRGNSLELFRPCADRQLVRVNVQTGEVTEFEKGVSESYSEAGFRFELQRDRAGKVHQYVEPPGRDRREIDPPFLGRPLVLNGTRLAGLKDVVIERDEVDAAVPAGDAGPGDAGAAGDAGAGDAGAAGGADRKPETRRTFVMQDVASMDQYEPFQEEVEVDGGGTELLPVVISDVILFNDNRSSSFLWLIHHSVRNSGKDKRDGGPEEDKPDGGPDEPKLEHKVGTLSIFGERNLSLEAVGEGIPLRAPLGRSPTGVRGYSIETAPPFSEPLVVMIADAEPLESDPKLSKGRLEARLLSGELGSTIATGVTSYFLITSPLPGILYGIEEGDQAGLWFAAL